jgi:hypothetical protein
MASVECVVASIASDENAHPFGASYVARRAGVDVEEAYRRLEELAERHDLERHFELISPFTGRSLKGFHLGDKVPVGEVFEPEEDDEEPFIVTPTSIWVTFSPTAQFRATLTRKKKQARVGAQHPSLPPQVQADLRRAVQESRRIARSLGEASRRIRSEVREAFTTSRIR